MSIVIPFTKMAGAGNEFFIVDVRRHRLPALQRRWRAVSKALCDRRAGLGADGLLILEPSRRANVRMRVFNADGSEAQMCGNGARCVALYLRQETRDRRRETGKRPVRIETKAGLLSATVKGHRVAMRMTDPTDLRTDVSLNVRRTAMRVGFVNTGVPHAVVPVDRVDAVDVGRLGRLLRRHPTFAPGGANVNFVQKDPAHPSRLRVRTYERGVEAETPACGTGATASAVCHVARESRPARQGLPRTRRVAVQVRSGDTLNVSMTVLPSTNGPRVTQVVLEGPATRLVDGRVEWPLRRRV